MMEITDQFWLVCNYTVCSNSDKCCKNDTMIGSGFLVQMANEQFILSTQPKNILNQRKKILLNGCFLTYWRQNEGSMKEERPINNQRLKLATVKAWPSISRDETCWWLICIQILKMYLYLYFWCSVTFESAKIEELYNAWLQFLNSSCKTFQMPWINVFKSIVVYRDTFFLSPPYKVILQG